MKIFKDKEGNKLTYSEFISRWKEGISKISALQQLKIMQRGYYIVLIGIIVGLFVSFKYHQWWLMIILFGSLFISGISALGNFQKIHQIEKIEAMMKQLSLIHI